MQSKAALRVAIFSPRPPSPSSCPSWPLAGRSQARWSQWGEEGCDLGLAWLCMAVRTRVQASPRQGERTSEAVEVGSRDGQLVF